jgi:hypothetical protein
VFKVWNEKPQLFVLQDKGAQYQNFSNRQWIFLPVLRGPKGQKPTGDKLN